MVRTITQAARYIDRVGFCLLFPIKGLRLPSLWAAVKGIPNLRDARNFNLVAAWDKDTERLWDWKDELPRRRLAYSGRYFRGRESLLALAFLPCFYRLEGQPEAGPPWAKNYGTPEEFEELYRAGKITADARAICQQLYKHGPQATLELRYALGWSSRRGNQRFKKATAELQRRLLIVHWGAKAETRAWESVVYELTARAFPQAMRAAARLSRAEARERIAAQYRKLVPRATPADFQRLFGFRG